MTSPGCKVQARALLPLHRRESSSDHRAALYFLQCEESSQLASFFPSFTDLRRTKTARMHLPRREGAEQHISSKYLLSSLVIKQALRASSLSLRAWVRLPPQASLSGPRVWAFPGSTRCRGFSGQTWLCGPKSGRKVCFLAQGGSSHQIQSIGCCWVAAGGIYQTKELLLGKQLLHSEA